MAAVYRLVVFMILLTFCPTPVQAEKPKPKLLDGELIEDGQPAPAPAPPPADHHTTQTVVSRQEFAVALPSNPATGCGWRVAAYDREFLQLLRHRYQKPPETRPGAVGQELFDFLALQRGTTTIIFYYQQPFAKQVARDFKHTVVIK